MQPQDLGVKVTNIRSYPEIAEPEEVEYRSIPGLDFASFSIFDIPMFQGAKAAVEEGILETATQIPFTNEITVAISKPFDSCVGIILIEGEMFVPKNVHEYTQAMIALRSLGYDGRPLLDFLSKGQDLTETRIRTILSTLKPNPSLAKSITDN